MPVADELCGGGLSAENERRLAAYLKGKGGANGRKGRGGGRGSGMLEEWGVGIGDLRAALPEMGEGMQCFENAVKSHTLPVLSSKPEQATNDDNDFLGISDNGPSDLCLLLGCANGSLHSHRKSEIVEKIGWDAISEELSGDHKTKVQTSDVVRRGSRGRSIQATSSSSGKEQKDKKMKWEMVAVSWVGRGDAMSRSRGAGIGKASDAVPSLADAVGSPAAEDVENDVDLLTAHNDFVTKGSSDAEAEAASVDSTARTVETSNGESSTACLTQAAVDVSAVTSRLGGFGINGDEQSGCGVVSAGK